MTYQMLKSILPTDIVNLICSYNIYPKQNKGLENFISAFNLSSHITDKITYEHNDNFNIDCVTVINDHAYFVPIYSDTVEILIDGAHNKYFSKPFMKDSMKIFKNRINNGYIPEILNMDNFIMMMPYKVVPILHSQVIPIFQRTKNRDQKLFSIKKSRPKTI